MSQYIKVANRIIDCVERRSVITATSPRLGDMVDQLSIRSEALSVATVNMEIAALRKIISEAEMTPKGCLWPTGVNVRPWMHDVDQDELDHTIASVMRPYKEIRSSGSDILNLDIERARHNGYDLVDEELIELISGKQGDNRARPSQKSQRFLNERDLSTLEMELSDFDPLDSLETLNSGKARLEGTLRLFINVMWFTGMRPTEVWNCILMIPRTDIVFTRQMAELVDQNPARAIHEELMVPVEQVSAETKDSLGVAARNAMNQTGASSILLIKSAKTTNQNPNLKSDYRLQVLKNIPTRQLNLIAIATQCRRLHLSEKRKDSIRASISRILKSVADNVGRFDGMNINLYAFRHSFATRAKLAMEPHEAAALTGHTSKNTLHGYGQRNLRKAKGVSRFSRDWLPSPDPVFAEHIRLSWSGKTASPAAAPGIHDG